MAEYANTSELNAEGIVSGVRPVESSGIFWINPFSGELEAWHSSEMAVASQLRAAALRINELQAEIDAIKEKMGDQQPS